ncbi:MAG: hypothetical protein ABSH49_09540 [Bryobacteraceae bacterium]
MFTWICPQCGREVPPAYNDCPHCAELAAQNRPPAVAPPPEAPPPPGYPAPQASPPPPQAYPTPPGYPAAQAYPPPGYQPPQPPPPQPPPAFQPPQPSPPPAYQAPQPAPPPPSQSYSIAPDLRYVPPQPAAAYNPPPRRTLPVWLLTVLAVAAFGGIFAGIYALVGSSHGSQSNSVSAVESSAAKPGAAVSPAQKFIEIAGVRFLDDPKHKDQAMVQFLVINHSPADWTGVKGNVTLWGSTQRSEEDAQGTFTFTTDLKPFGSAEMTAPLDSKKKIYELADWQNLTTDLQITSPAAPPSAQ